MIDFNEKLTVIEFLKTKEKGLPHKIIKKLIKNGELKINQIIQNDPDFIISHEDNIIFRNRRYELISPDLDGDTLWLKVEEYIGEDDFEIKRKKKRYILSLLVELTSQNSYDLILQSKFKESFRDILKTIRSDGTFYKEAQVNKLKDKKLFNFLFSKMEEVEQSMNEIIGQCKNHTINFNTLLQNIHKLIKSTNYQWLVEPQVDISCSSEKLLKELILSVQKITETEDLTNKVKIYEDKKALFFDYKKIVKEYKQNKFVKIFYEPFVNILFDKFKLASSVNEEAEGNIEVDLSNRKYNLELENPDFEIHLIAKNTGSGLATETTISLAPNANYVKPYIKKIGVLQPGDSRQIKISSHFIPSQNGNEINLIIRWKNTSSSVSESNTTLTLREQSKDIDWDFLQSESSIYSLNKIDRIENLFGRASIMNRLIENATSDSIQSYKLWGQKRVGKSSIVKTLEHELDDDMNIIVSLITVPRNIDATTTMNEIGTEICRDLKRKIRSSSLPKKEELLMTPISVFNGSLTPLKNYLEDLHDINSELKFLLILDEVDRLNDEFFKPGDFGESFSLAVGKTINDFKYCGFILVGSENMNLLDYQQINYNSFIDEKVDTFDLVSQYNDFSELIRKPVMGNIIYSDESIREIFSYTNGNPYFTNIICQKILKKCCITRNNEVHIEQVQDAFKKYVSSESKQSFAHFWDDGLKRDTKEEKDRLSDVRRRILISYANYFQEKKSLPNEQNIINYFNFPSEYKVPNSEIKNVIQNFISRGIFVIENKRIQIVPKLFSDWLCFGNGINQIIEGVADLEAQIMNIEQNNLSKVTDNEIDRLVEKINFKENKYSLKRIKDFLQQFGENQDQRKIFKLLDLTCYISNSEVTRFFKDIRKKVFGEEINLGLNRALTRSEGLHFITSNKYKNQNDPYFDTFKKLNSILGTRKLKSCLDKEFLSDIPSSQNTLILFETICLKFNDSFHEYYTLFKKLSELKNPPKISIIILIASKQFLNELDVKLDQIGLNYLDSPLVFKTVELSEVLPFSQTSSLFEDQEEKSIINSYINNFAEEYGKSQIDNCSIIFEKFCPVQSVEVLWNNKLPITPFLGNNFDINFPKVQVRKTKQKKNSIESRNDEVNKLDQEVSDLEEWLRFFIVAELRKNKTIITLLHLTNNTQIINTIKEKIVKHKKRNPYIDVDELMNNVEEALEFSDLSDLELLICGKSYKYFEDTFGIEDEFKKRFSQIMAFRIQKRHSRRTKMNENSTREYDDITINDCKAAIEWFKRIRTRLQD